MSIFREIFNKYVKRLLLSAAIITTLPVNASPPYGTTHWMLSGLSNSPIPYSMIRDGLYSHNIFVYINIDTFPEFQEVEVVWHNNANARLSQTIILNRSLIANNIRQALNALRDNLLCEYADENGVVPSHMGFNFNFVDRLSDAPSSRAIIIEGRVVLDTETNERVMAQAQMPGLIAPDALVHITTVPALTQEEYHTRRENGAIIFDPSMFSSLFSNVRDTSAISRRFGLNELYGNHAGTQIANVMTRYLFMHEGFHLFGPTDLNIPAGSVGVIHNFSELADSIDAYVPTILTYDIHEYVERLFHFNDQRTLTIQYISIGGSDRAAFYKNYKEYLDAIANQNSH